MLGGFSFAVPGEAVHLCRKTQQKKESKVTDATFSCKQPVIPEFLVTFARKDNSLRINRLVGLLENWVMR